MSKIKRFDIRNDELYGLMSDSDEKGEYCYSDDVDKLEHKNAKLVEALEHSRHVADEFAENRDKLINGDVSKEEVVDKLFIAFKSIHSKTIQTLAEVKGE